jgi:hypothetical protein
LKRLGGVDTAGRGGRGGGHDGVAAAAAGVDGGAFGAGTSLTETLGKVQRARDVAMEFE